MAVKKSKICIIKYERRNKIIITISIIVIYILNFINMCLQKIFLF